MTTDHTQMRPVAPSAPGHAAAGSSERLVRSRSGRLVPESQVAGPPVADAARPLHPALKATLVAAGVGVVTLALLILFDTRAGGTRESLEDFFRDYGYVIREMRGPGLGK